MKKFILLLTVVLLFGFINLHAQFDTVLCPHKYLYHPADTVISDGNHLSPTFNKHFVKRLYLKSEVDLFGSFPNSYLLNTDSILPQYHNQKLLLKSLDSNFGIFIIKYDTMNVIDINSR